MAAVCSFDVQGVQALLDLLAASQGYVSYAATVLR